MCAHNGEGHRVRKIEVAVHLCFPLADPVGGHGDMDHESVVRTPAQADASRANGAHSAGPVTA